MLARNSFTKALFALAAVWALSTSAAAQDACFQRNQNFAAVATIICNEPGLNNVDRQLFEKLRDFAAVVPDRHSAEFNALLAEWLNERNGCRDVACLQEYYTRTVPIWFDLIKMMSGESA